MSIFDIFSPKPEAPAAPVQQPVPQPVPGGQGNIPPVQAVVAEPGNPTAPVTPVAPTAPESPKDDSPLAEFKNLWETKPIDPNAPKPPGPAPELNAEAIQKVIANIDFSKQVTPENLAAISAGGEDAQAAFASAMNSVAQQVMIQATLVNNKLTERAVEQAKTSFQDSLPELLRSQASADHLRTSNPLFSNPAMKPVIEATHSQLLDKFPHATHAEIAKMTENYIVAMGESFAPKASVNDNAAAGEVDWDAFLSAK